MAGTGSISTRPPVKGGPVKHKKTGGDQNPNGRDTTMALDESSRVRRILTDIAAQGRVATAPLMGFPGVKLVGSTVKIAQQNCREHFKAIRFLYGAFEPDVIFPLMDLSVEANALGFYTLFPVDETPTVVASNFAIEQLNRLRDIDISFDARIAGYVETVRLMARQLPERVVKGAYVIGPFTLAGLMMGASNAAMALLMDPAGMHRLCDFTFGVVEKYSRLLMDAGADLICFLEPSAVFLGPEQFREFSAAHLVPLVAECTDRNVATLYHICGNSTHLVEQMVASGVTGLSLDSPETGIDIVKVLESVPSSVAVVGNTNPTSVMLYGSSEQVELDVAGLLEAAGRYPNFILGSGCDLPLETPRENIAAFMRAAAKYRREGAAD